MIKHIKKIFSIKVKSYFTYHRVKRILYLSSVAIRKNIKKTCRNGQANLLNTLHIRGILINKHINWTSIEKNAVSDLRKHINFITKNTILNTSAKQLFFHIVHTFHGIYELEPLH